MKRVSLLILIIVLSLVLFCNSKYFIKLNGNKEMTINLNEDYIELGAKTLFNQKVKIIGNVDNKTVGIYEIKYCYNSCKSRIVNVVDKEKPLITLKGDSEINIVINGEYHEQGYTAFDNYDGDLTDKVVVKNNLDITKEGIYEIIYEVTDSSNNKEIKSK